MLTVLKTRPTDNDETLKALTPVLVDALCTLGESGRPRPPTGSPDGRGRRCATAIQSKLSASTR